jgi:hypothetical protein
LTDKFTRSLRIADAQAIARIVSDEMLSALCLELPTRRFQLSHESCR